MARPPKNTVDYFPHYVHNGKTLFVLENKFGNNGYAFWFKLLELLGNAEGHFYDCNNLDEWEFLVAKTHVDPVSGTEILNTLATLKAIDKDLWEKKVIWSQNFVNNLSSVYKKRGLAVPNKPDLIKSPKKEELPIFPSSSEKNGVSGTETNGGGNSCAENVEVEDVSVPETIQSKVKNIKQDLDQDLIQSRFVYGYYKDHVRAGAKNDAILSIKKLLKEGKTKEELCSYIDNYAEEIKKKGTDPDFKIQANNFFGRSARWLEYLTKTPQQPDPRARDLLNKFYKIYCETHKGRPPFVVESDLSSAAKIVRIYKNDDELEQCVKLFFGESFWRKFPDKREAESFKQFYQVIQVLMEHLPQKAPWSKK